MRPGHRERRRPAWLGWQEPAAPNSGTPRLPPSPAGRCPRPRLFLGTADEIPLGKWLAEMIGGLQSGRGERMISL